MSIGFSLRGQRAEWESPPNVRLTRAGEQEDSTAKVLGLVGEGRRVLALGGASTLIERLREQDCEVVRVPIESGTGTAGSPEQSALHELAGKENFDVVVAVHALEYLHDPLTVLEGAKKCLRPEGHLVVAVPNVAHGNVRLALLGGRFPFGANGVFADAPLRFFTYESLVELLETAQFALGVLERLEEDVSVPDGASPAGAADLLPAVVQAPEARTAQFIALAHPLPRADLSWLQSRLRGLAEQHAAARQEVQELRQDFDAVNDHVRLLIELQEAANAREKELCGRIEDLHEELVRRDEEFRTASQGLQEAASSREAECRRLAAEVEIRERHLQRLRHTLPGRIYRLLRQVQAWVRKK